MKLNQGSFINFFHQFIKPADGMDIYVGSTSLSVKDRLRCHMSHAKRYNSILYKRMFEVGIYNWEILPLLIYICNQKEICEFEKNYVELLKPDLNTVSPSDTNNKWNHTGLKEIKKKHYCNSIKSKKFYCDVCNCTFGSNTDLLRHFKTLKHSNNYMNSVD